MMRGLGRIAKVVTSAALSIALALGGIASGVAWADGDAGTGTGTIKISANSGNDGMVYNVYKIFTCDVDSTGKTASTISWPSTDMANAVKSAIVIYDQTQSTNDLTAARCAEYILDMFIETGSTARISANGFAMNLAKAIDDQSITTTLTAGAEPVSLAEGYYMIVSQPSSLADATKAMVGTAPIYTLLGEGQALAISEKTSLPTFTKNVVEDSASTSGGRTYADAQVGQEVSYTLTGTVSDSINSFTKYIYAFEDVLPEGMDLKLSNGEPDVTVQITTGSTAYTVTEGYGASYSDHKLTVSFADLKVAKGTTDSNATAATIPLDASSKIAVSYTAALNGSASLGAGGNANTAKLIYGNNPQVPSTSGTSVEKSATVCTYGLTLVKVDQSKELDSDSGNTESLSGAQFTIQAKTTDEGTSSGKYLSTSGAFGDKTSQPTANDTDYVFTTGSDGTFSVSGLDAGTYVIHELVAPSGYTLSPDLELTLKVDKDEDGTTGVTTSLTGGEADGEDTDNNGVLDKGTRAAYDGTTGIVTVVMTNSNSIRLPLTGLPGITLVYVTGGAILAVSLAVLVRRQLKAEGVR